MQRPVDSIQDSEWQGLINAEMALASPKTVVNAFKFLRTVIRQQTGHEIPMNGLTLPSVPLADTAFLTADEIPQFVDAIKGSRVAVAALLALSSLRISEISRAQMGKHPEKSDVYQSLRCSRSWLRYCLGAKETKQEPNQHPQRPYPHPRALRGH